MFYRPLSVEILYILLLHNQVTPLSLLPQHLSQKRPQDSSLEFRLLLLCVALCSPVCGWFVPSHIGYYLHSSVPNSLNRAEIFRASVTYYVPARVFWKWLGLRRSFLRSLLSNASSTTGILRMWFMCPYMPTVSVGWRVRMMCERRVALMYAWRRNISTARTSTCSV